MAKGFDYGKLEDDMSAPPAKAAPAPKPAPTPKPKPDPRDANIFTADKGIQPPSPDEGPTKGKKKGGCVKMAKGGSASARADGCAQRGKTKGRMV